MRTLIAYASKTGTTAKAAHLLGEKMQDVTLRDLTSGSPNPDDYDRVIMGSSIRMGLLHKAARKWLTDNWNVVKQKQYAFFICNGFIDQAPQIIQSNFSEEALQGAVCVDSFGGEMDYKKLKGMDRFVTKMVMNDRKGKGQDFLPCILTDRIQIFADTLKEKQ